MKQNQPITLAVLLCTSAAIHADIQWGLAYNLDILSYDGSDTLGSIHESPALSARLPANEFISVGLTLRAPGSKKQVKSTLLSLSSREELHAVTTYHSQYHWGITLDSRITAPDLASSPVQPYIKAGVNIEHIDYFEAYRIILKRYVDDVGEFVEYARNSYPNEEEEKGITIGLLAGAGLQFNASDALSAHVDYSRIFDNRSYRRNLFSIGINYSF